MVTTCKPSRHYTIGEKTLLSTQLFFSGGSMYNMVTTCRQSHQTVSKSVLLSLLLSRRGMSNMDTTCRPSHPTKTFSFYKNRYYSVDDMQTKPSDHQLKRVVINTDITQRTRNEQYGHNMQTKPTDHRRKRVLSLLLNRRRMNTIRQSCCNRSREKKQTNKKQKRNESQSPKIKLQNSCSRQSTPS